MKKLLVKKTSFLYDRIADKLRDAIEDRTLQPGDKLPSFDDLAKRYNANRLTVARAISLLKDEGYLYALPAKGTFVTDRPPRANGNGAAHDTFTVGCASRVMIPGQTGLYHLELMESIRASLGALHANFSMLPVNVDQPHSMLLGTVERANLDALLTIGPLDADVLTRLTRLIPHLVILDHDAPPEVPADILTFDNRRGGFLAGDHLLRKGHRHIAVITGDDQPVTQARLNGFRDALAQHHLAIEPDLIIRSDFREHGGVDATRELLEKRAAHPVTAVFYMNDEMALGGLSILRQSGLRIPEDISLVGFDNIRLTSSRYVNLTTVAPPLVWMGQLAVQWIDEYRRAPYREFRNIRLEPRLVERGSVLDLKPA